MLSAAVTREESERLFEEVAAVTGLAKIIARGTIQRALATVHASVETATPEDYVAAMPELRKKLAAFVDDLETRQRLDRLERQLSIRAGLISARIQLRHDGGSE